MPSSRVSTCPYDRRSDRKAAPPSASTTAAQATTAKEASSAPESSAIQATALVGSPTTVLASASAPMPSRIAFRASVFQFAGAENS